MPDPSRSIFVNVPVTDLQRSMGFFRELGFTFNKQFTDEKAACMVVNDGAYVMLLAAPYFKTFIKKPVSDARAQAEAIFAFSVNSRQEVDEVADRALTAGGQPSNDPMDHGFMYLRSFQDPDGHLWEVLWMDPAVVEKQEA